jgi:hypothetical protein
MAPCHGRNAKTRIVQLYCSLPVWPGCRLSLAKKITNGMNKMADLWRNKLTSCSRGESLRSRSIRYKSKGIREVGGEADNEACTVHTFNIISQRQYFVPRCLISCVGNAFGRRSEFVFRLPAIK